MKSKQKITRKVKKSHRKVSRSPETGENERLVRPGTSIGNFIACQRQYGNQAVQRLLAQRVHTDQADPVQAKTGLEISSKPPQLPGMILQRAQIDTIEQPTIDAFSEVSKLLTTSGDPKTAFGLTYPMKVKSARGDPLVCEIWSYIGLAEGKVDVDTEKTNAKNWEEKIQGLASMGNKGKFYSKEAVRAHEDVHLNSFKAIIKAKEKEIISSANLIHMLRKICEAQGNKDHTNGSTDKAELPVILQKIEDIWSEAHAENFEPSRDTKYSIESQYQQVRKFLLLGKKNKVLTKVILEPDGTISQV